MSAVSDLSSQLTGKYVDRIPEVYIMEITRQIKNLHHRVFCLASGEQRLQSLLALPFSIPVLPSFHSFC